jgi:hypothetical protein
MSNLVEQLRSGNCAVWAFALLFSLVGFLVFAGMLGFGR